MDVTTMTMEEMEALAQAIASRKAEMENAERVAREALAVTERESCERMIATLATFKTIRAEIRFAPSTASRVSNRAPSEAKPFVSERSGRVSYMTDAERAERAAARRYAAKRGWTPDNGLWNAERWITAYRQNGNALSAAENVARAILAERSANPQNA